MQLVLDATQEDLKVFLDEAEEQLQTLDADLITLEKTGAEPELLQEIFRVAHTLKGSSASIGHNRMAELTHAMESVLDSLRHGEFDVSTELIDILLEGLDALRVLNHEVVTLQITDFDIKPLVAKLLVVAESKGKSTPAPEVKPNASGTSHLSEMEQNELDEQEARGSTIYQLSVEISENTALLAARGVQVLIELSNISHIIRSTPSQADLEAGKASTHVEVICASKVDADQLRSVIAAILDVATVVVGPYDRNAHMAAANNDERVQDLGPTAVNAPDERRLIDLGPQSRGKSKEEMLKVAGTKMDQLAKTVRIDVERLDKLMNLVGELVIDNTRLVQIAGKLQGTYGDEELVDRLAEASSHLGRLTDELQQEIMKSRMLPVDNVFNKFPRMVRNLAQKKGKEIDFQIHGQETELDRSVIEEIGDPLLHLLRNAADHGIETPDKRVEMGKPRTGTIKLSAYHQENHIVITVEDDGKGVDPVAIRNSAIRKGVLTPEMAERLTDQEAINLIFAPGFSTAEKISDVSGRGVGLDIVRTNIERLNGSVDVDGIPGKGTVFTIKLPLTLAIIRALLVSVANNVYAIPLVYVTETMRIDVDQIHHVNNREAVLVRGQVLPLLRLKALFAVGTNGHKDIKRYMVVAVKHAGRQVGLVVDTLIGEQEVVIKSLGRYVGDVKGISGAAILGDGRVGLIVDAAALVQVAIDEQMGRVVKQ
jgi:two-component system chemotaxis sensor kinase CheA